MPLKTLGLLALLVVAAFVVAIVFARFIDHRWPVALAILGALLLIAAWLCFRPYLRRVLSLAPLALLIPLAACAGTANQVLTNINASCDREYKGSINGGVLVPANFSGSFSATCYAANHDNVSALARPPAARSGTGAVPAGGAAAAPAAAVTSAGTP